VQTNKFKPFAGHDVAEFAALAGAERKRIFGERERKPVRYRCNPRSAKTLQDSAKGRCSKASLHMAKRNG